MIAIVAFIGEVRVTAVKGELVTRWPGATVDDSGADICCLPGQGQELS